MKRAPSSTLERSFKQEESADSHIVNIAADPGEQLFLERTLRVLAWTVFVLLAAVALLNATQGRFLATVGQQIGLVGVLLALACLRVHKLRLGWGIFIVAGCAMFAANVFLAGGLSAPHLSGFLVLVVIAGRMLGPRWAVVLAAVLVALLLSLAKMHVLGIVPPSDFSQDPYRQAFVYIQQFVTLGVFCWYAFKRNQEQIAELQQSMARQDEVAAEAAQARRQFEAVFRASPAALSLYQSDVARNIDCNDAYVRLLDRPREEIISHTGLEMGMWRNPQDRAQARAMRDRGEPVQDFEFDLITGKGEIRRCALHWSDVEINGRQFVLSHISDLTHRHRMEQALAASEQRFQDFAHASGDWFWETDAQGRFVWVSDSVAAINGTTADEHYGKTRADFAGSTDEFTAEPWKSHWESLERHEPFRDFRYRRQSVTGEHWISVSGIPRFGTGGEFLGYRGAGSDVQAIVEAEQKASRANLLLRSAIEELNASFVLCDPSDRIVIANRRFRAAYPAAQSVLDQGCTFEQYLRIACGHGYFPDAIGSEEAFVARRLAQWREPGTPFELRLSNGIFLLVSDLKLADGSTISTGLDITERKRADDELSASRQLLEQVIDAIPLSIFVKDQNSNYLMVNMSFVAFHRTTKQKFLGRHTSTLPTPDATRQKSLRDDEWVFENRRTLDQPDTLLQDPDGHWVPFHSTKIPLLDNTGEPIGLLGINRNITDDKQAKEALVASEARFSALFHNSIVPQFVTVPGSRRLEEVNAAFVALSGYTREQLIAEGDQPPWLFPYEEDRVALESLIANGQTAGTIGIGLRRANGERRTVVGSTFTINTPTGPRFAWSINDVTDQRAAQRQLREMNEVLEQSVRQRTGELTLANAGLQAAMHNLKASQDALLRSEKTAALGRMVAGVAHELNTPIGNGLLAATTLAHKTQELVVELQKGLRRTTLDTFVAEAQEVSQILQRNLERAAQLIMSFKQVAVDQTSSQRRSFDLKDVVNEVVLSLRPTLRSSGVNIVVEIPSDIGLDSFPGPLGQVIGNLIENAVVHGYEGEDGGLITITALRPVEGCVAINVQDKGRGIAPSNIARVFDPFFTTRFGKGGSGLGLNIVHHIVTDLLGGKISVESQPGAGACFYVNIPLVAPK